MTFVKSENGERVSAIDATGKTVAYIEKNRFGTHGHWHGWKHYPWCEPLGKCIWACVAEDIVFSDRAYKPFVYWTDKPSWFANIKEFKDYYFQRERQS